MHDLLQLALSFHTYLHPILASGSAPSDGSSTAIEVSLIGGGSLVIGGLVPALLGRRERIPAAVKERVATEILLRQTITADRDQWKNTAEAAIRGTEVRDNEINRLRAIALEHGADPDDIFIPVPPPVEGGAHNAPSPPDD